MHSSGSPTTRIEPDRVPVDPPVLSIFSASKPSEGRTAAIQRNAITSWALLRPRPEIIVFGDESGTSEVCADLGLRHVPELADNEFGSKLVSDLFGQAQRLARGDVVCYVNSDIVLMNDFMDALWRIVAWHRKPFLAIGTRWNVGVRDSIDFSSDWEDSLRRAVEAEGEPGGPLDHGLLRVSSRSLRAYPPVRRRKALLGRLDGLCSMEGPSLGDRPHGHGDGGASTARLRALPGLRDATHVISARGVASAWRARGVRQWLFAAVPAECRPASGAPSDPAPTYPHGTLPSPQAPSIDSADGLDLAGAQTAPLRGGREQVAEIGPPRETDEGRSTVGGRVDLAVPSSGVKGQEDGQPHRTRRSAVGDPRLVSDRAAPCVAR